MTAQTTKRPLPNVLAIIAFVLAVAGLFFPRPSSSPGPQGLQPSSISRIDASKTLVIGFEGYPPYASENQATGQVTGFSVDLVNAIAQAAGWQTRWVKTTPDTKIIDLNNHRFDMMAEPIFQTIPRATAVAFTAPYAQFGYASAIVRQGDNRFTSPQDMDRSGVRIVVRLGYTDQGYATSHFKAATVDPMKVDDVSLLFLEVASGRADAALADTAQVLAYAKEHSNVTALFTSPPPATVPAGFALRYEDGDLRVFLDTALRIVGSGGDLAALRVKYNIPE